MLNYFGPYTPPVLVITYNRNMNILKNKYIVNIKNINFEKIYDYMLKTVVNKDSLNVLVKGNKGTTCYFFSFLL